MINPFFYQPCKTWEEFAMLPATMTFPNETQQGFTFLKRSFNPETKVAEYVWDDLVKNAYSALVG